MLWILFSSSSYCGRARRPEASCSCLHQLMAASASAPQPCAWHIRRPAQSGPCPRIMTRLSQQLAKEGQREREIT